MLKLSYPLYVFGIGLLVWACKRSEPAEQLMYIKPAAEKLDRYCTYIENPKNYVDSGYMDFCYSRFQQLLQAQKIDSAAQVLNCLGKTIWYNAVADSNFVHRVRDFQQKYQEQLSDRYAVGLNIIIGKYYLELAEYERATFYFLKTQVPVKGYYALRSVASGNYYLIFSHLDNGKGEKALIYGQRALDLFTKLNETRMMGLTCAAIAYIHQYLEDYPTAERYINQAFYFLKQNNDAQPILATSFDKLSHYQVTNEKKMLAFVDTTLAFFQAMSVRYAHDSLSVYSWYAYKLAKTNQLALAKSVLEKIRPINARTDNEVSKDYFTQAWAEYELKKKNGPSNPSFYMQQIPELMAAEKYVRAKVYADILVDGFLLQNDYQQAFKYAEIYDAARDSLSKNEIRHKVKELDKKYQTEKKEQQIRLQKAEIKKQGAFITLLFAALLGILLSVIIYYLWQRQKRLQQAQNNSLNYTRQLLENTEEERRRIASDLHDSISHELLNLNTSLSEDVAVVKTKIDSIINDIRGISRNLHPVMFDKIGLLPNLEQLVERLELQQQFLVSTEIEYSGSLSSATELQLYRIVQEALSNTIKYANAHAAKITLKEKPGELFVEIRDNGRGFDVSKALNSGKAFGLHNIIERSRVIGGKAELRSSPQGTIIGITIPYSTAS